MPIPATLLPTMSPWLRYPSLLIQAGNWHDLKISMILNIRKIAIKRLFISWVLLSLVIGGAVGNLVDRARFGAVVDFLDFSGLYFPWIFNVADAAISVGAAFLLLDQLLASRKPRV